MDNLHSSTVKLVQYAQSFHYDKWKYTVPDDGDSSQIIDKLVHTDPDKFTALEITRRYCIGAAIGAVIQNRQYSLTLNIRTVNQRISIDNLHEVVGTNEFNALIARFEKEHGCYVFNTYFEMCKELGL